LDIRYPIPKCLKNGLFTSIADLTENPYPDNSSCPSMIEPLPDFEGAFVAYECGDFCHLTIRLDNGTEEYFLAGGDIQEAIDAPNSGYKAGTKVKLTAHLEQFLETEFSGECIKSIIATSISKR
jgi:hypothetical protein